MRFVRSIEPTRSPPTLKKTHPQIDLTLPSAIKVQDDSQVSWNFVNLSPVKVHSDGKRKRQWGESRAWQRDRRSLNPLTLTSSRAGATAARSQHVRPRAALHRRPSFLSTPGVAVAMRCDSPRPQLTRSVFKAHTGRGASRRAVT